MTTGKDVPCLTTLAKKLLEGLKKILIIQKPNWETLFGLDITIFNAIINFLTASIEKDVQALPVKTSIVPVFHICFKADWLFYKDVCKPLEMEYPRGAQLCIRLFIIASLGSSMNQRHFVGMVVTKHDWSFLVIFQAENSTSIIPFSTWELPWGKNMKMTDMHTYFIKYHWQWS